MQGSWGPVFDTSDVLSCRQSEPVPSCRRGLQRCVTNFKSYLKRIIIIIIIIITRYQLGFDRPVPARSNSIFKVLPSPLSPFFFYISALFLAPRWCSFSLHVESNLICIFFVSRHLVLLSTFPNFSSFLCCQK
jgi:hypothetical protein